MDKFLIPFANKDWFLQYLHSIYEFSSASDIPSCVDVGSSWGKSLLVLSTVPGCGQWACKNKNMANFPFHAHLIFFHTLSLRITPNVGLKEEKVWTYIWFQPQGSGSLTSVGHRHAQRCIWCRQMPKAEQRSRCIVGVISYVKSYCLLLK